MISNTIKNSLSWYLQQGTPNKITPRLLYPHSLHICSNSDFVSGIFCCSLAPAEPLGDHQPLPGQCSRCPCLLCKGSTWIPCSFPGAPDTSPPPRVPSRAVHTATCTRCVNQQGSSPIQKQFQNGRRHAYF